MKPRIRGWLVGLGALLIACGGMRPARAETIRIAAEYGISYLPLTIIQTQHILERLGAAQGLDIKTRWLQFTGGASMNEALIAGQLDIASGGVAPMVLLWSRTRDNLHVRGISALNSMPLYLNTIDANVHSIKDFTSKDRIAMPAAGVSIQAITLMMAAAKTFGPAEAKKLNPLMVSMSHPDGMAALLARKAGITAHFTSPPYMFEELAEPGVHRVLDSYDVLGGPATFNVVWTTGRFVQRNPKLVPIFLAALGGRPPDHRSSGRGGDNLHGEHAYLALGGRAREHDQESGGTLDNFARADDAVCRVHGEDRHDPGSAGELEGSLLPRDRRSAGKLRSRTVQ